jgi:hypothetical protein
MPAAHNTDTTDPSTNADPHDMGIQTDATDAAAAGSATNIHTGKFEVFNNNAMRPAVRRAAAAEVMTCGIIALSMATRVAVRSAKI